MLVIAQQNSISAVVWKSCLGTCYANYGFKDGSVYCKYLAHFVTSKYCSEVC